MLTTRYLELKYQLKFCVRVLEDSLGRLRRVSATVERDVEKV
jgi:hypothetical protein